MDVLSACRAALSASASASSSSADAETTTSMMKHVAPLVAAMLDAVSDPDVHDDARLLLALNPTVTSRLDRASSPASSSPSTTATGTGTAAEWKTERESVEAARGDHDLAPLEVIHDEEAYDAPEAGPHGHGRRRSTPSSLGFSSSTLPREWVPSPPRPPPASVTPGIFQDAFEREEAVVRRRPRRGGGGEKDADGDIIYTRLQEPAGEPPPTWDELLSGGGPSGCGGPIQSQSPSGGGTDMFAGGGGAADSILRRHLSALGSLPPPTIDVPIRLRCNHNHEPSGEKKDKDEMRAGRAAAGEVEGGGGIFGVLLSFAHTTRHVIHFRQEEEGEVDGVDPVMIPALSTSGGGRGVGGQNKYREGTTTGGNDHLPVSAGAVLRVTPLRPLPATLAVTAEFSDAAGISIAASLPPLRIPFSLLVLPPPVPDFFVSDDNDDTDDAAATAAARAYNAAVFEPLWRLCTSAAAPPCPPPSSPPLSPPHPSVSSPGLRRWEAAYDGAESVFAIDRPRRAVLAAAAAAFEPLLIDKDDMTAISLYATDGGGDDDDDDDDDDRVADMVVVRCMARLPPTHVLLMRLEAGANTTVVRLATDACCALPHAERWARDALMT